MNRQRADTIVGGAVVAVLVIGGLLSWQAYRQRQAVDQMGSMMGTSMGTVHGPNPLWYVLGTLLVAAVVAGGYLAVRDDLDSAGSPARSPADPDTPTDSAPVGSPDDDTRPAAEIAPETQPRDRLLDLLPEDERRVLEPVIASPGLTQIELRDRADFSKSKVSQTVSALEKRGLLYRERQGRTYRVYPSDELQQDRSGS